MTISITDNEHWRDLAINPPTGDRCVVLFLPSETFGIPFTASSADFARVNGLQFGYTKWMEIPRLTDDLEAEMATNLLACQQDGCDEDHVNLL